MGAMRNVSTAVLFLWVAGIRPVSAEQASERAFAELEKWLIGAYLEDEERRGGGDARGSDRKDGVDRGQLDAGTEGLMRDQTLPSGLEVSDLPRELESRLPPLPEGLERVIVDGQVALIERTSRRVQDLFDPGEARENGPPRELAVCHVPPGNPSRRRTLGLPEPAIRSHLDHGDYIGRCR